MARNYNLVYLLSINMSLTILPVYSKKIIAESEWYKIIHYPANSDILFITFSGITGNLSHNPFGLKFLREAGYEVIGCLQKERSFYQGLSFEYFRKVVQPYARGKRVRLYGCSLGGYCAIYYAGAVNGAALAISPRLSLHPQLLALRRDRIEATSVFQHRNIVDNVCARSNITVLLDPGDKTDIRFLEKVILPAYPDARTYHLGPLGHSAELMRHLLDGERLKPLLHAFANGREKDVDDILHKPWETDLSRCMRAWCHYQEGMRNLYQVVDHARLPEPQLRKYNIMFQVFCAKNQMGDMKKMKSEIMKLNKINAQLKQDVGRERRLYEGVMKSRSWRLTRPLRALVDSINRLRDKFST